MSLRFSAHCRGVASENVGALVRREFQMRQAENGAARLVGETFDLPSRAPEQSVAPRPGPGPCPFRGGEVGFENLRATLGGHAGAVVTTSNRPPRRQFRADAIWISPLAGDGLDGIQHQIEQRLAQQLFVGFDARAGAPVTCKRICLFLEVDGSARAPLHRPRRRVARWRGGLRGGASN